MGQPSHPLDDADLHAFVDGQISIQQRAVFIEALSADPDAHARVDSWKRQNEALNATFGTILSEAVPLRLMPTNLGKDKRPAARRDLRAPADRGQMVPIPQPPVRRTVSRAFVTGVAIAAFSAGVLATYGVEMWGRAPGLLAGRDPVETTRPTGSRALVRRASEAHQTYAADLSLPADIPAADAGHLAKSIQHRLAVPVSIPDCGARAGACSAAEFSPASSGRRHF